MQILEGLLFINNVDVYVEYGAFLTEERADAHTNYDALQLPPEMKEYVAVNFREEDGEKLPDDLSVQRFKPRDVTLFFAIEAPGTTEWKLKYANFIRFLSSGWLNIRLPELDKTYKMYLKGFSNYEQLTPINHGPVVCRFKVKLREPQPNF